MQRIISVILSILMLFFGIFIPGITDPVDTITVGEWLSEVNSEFGMTTYESQDPYYETITADNAYFGDVQIAYEWGVIDSEDEIDVDAAVESEFAVKTLVNVANLEAVEGEEVLIKNADVLKYAEEVAVAVTNDIVELKKNGAFDNGLISYDDAIALLAKVKEMWANQSFDVPEYDVEYTEEVNEIDTTNYAIEDNVVTLPADVNVAEGETIVLPQTADNLEGAIFAVEAVETVGDKTVVSGTPVAADEVISNVKFEGAVAPDFTTAKITDANGNVIQAATADNEGILDGVKDKVKDVVTDKLVEKLTNVSFDIGKFNVKASIKEDGFDIAIAGNIVNGVNVAKTYSASNLDIQAKLDGNLVNSDIKEAYILLDYDAVDTTVVDGSYAASLVSDYAGDTTGLEVLEQIEKNFSELRLQNGGGAKIDVFTVDIPIPNCPSVTVSLDVSIVFNVYGQAKLVVTSHNCKGYEIINNKGRFINETVENNIDFTATGIAEATVGFGVGLGILTYDLMDLYLRGGVGAFVVANVNIPTDAGETTVSTNVPADVIAEATAVLDDADKIDVNGVAQFYGILYVAVGQNSLMSKVGLDKAWTIYDRSNGVFATINF